MVHPPRQCSGRGDDFSLTTLSIKVIYSPRPNKRIQQDTSRLRLKRKTTFTTYQPPLHSRFTMVKYDELTKMGEASVVMNGETVRKGSFYVGMVNGVAFEKLAEDPPAHAGELADVIIADIDKLPLVNAGAFEFFTPVEWLANGGEGRSLICLVYLRRVPEAITPEVQQALNARAKRGTSLFRQTVKKVLNNPSWYEY
ncbi:hypothetical protein SERLA73DRAFT_187125 [Serpula lacrymans var. lacrymans S7.3]|uniref:Uncharacterized protein n=2 Tax=Serpula lacrymans var. lacrymans TaxID=341189 RepID=F8Q8I7_SERL3|nr:uncharacterized protein SERLADRAFT_476515 [Serpula lacrymans var. lacrymans S7.9]EGN95875.1 hypothetical protein SERLA73DRAFT_187125 [Serpula lacrymans var. lacrymans S7.3]EGO21388.1 hypothetical protein SERLADRAFT_476515 [Serpula lacrymans var. lacrymans S7.9]